VRRIYALLRLQTKEPAMQAQRPIDHFDKPEEPTPAERFARFGTREYPMTPYRKGLLAGAVYRAELVAWERTCEGDRPEPPKCPYTTRARHAWRDGFHLEAGK
jgi:hypothetical protein